MRNHTSLLILVSFGLVLGAAGGAFAQGGQGGDAASQKADGRGAAENRTADDNRTHMGNESAREAMKARHQALQAARNASLASFHENRTLALEAYHAANNATRVSFLENKTAVIEACRAAREAANESEDADTGKCVRDGLKPLIEKARAEHAAHREALLDALREARGHAMKHFQAEKSRADARYGHARSG